ncbi:class II aldolase/adducin family protein [Acidovorax sp.]|jgi:ribulose-5-phosphate 4-epimerase/fuculose-1-phosphate aldolase|uniref:class II aldolase/adducin family protein n=1 Tax=Acidovorax sp. TaxID=1872122 RepID=UPI002ACD3CDC|nr:class II aldolase/adducin family protein [Acidovorax sp.]MDZ7866598.1 class II aldolase/adducin family protein [Acidovorax sp.]
MTTNEPAASLDAETQTRRDLAALYRLIAHFRMTDLIDTHISARIPGTPDHFLINRYGVLFHEMRPEDLVKIDPSGAAVEAGDAAERVNAAGFTIHSAVHMARHDLACVIHTHTADGIAVSCQEEGLLPITQHALKFYGHIGYHAYEGIALDLEERERLVASLGAHRVMILRNHGLLAAGRTIAEAFLNIYFLERACQAQTKALAGGRTITYPPVAVCERTAAQFNREEGLSHAQMAWESALRLIA